MDIKCATPGCQNPASQLRCPECKKIGIESRFCSEECYKKNYKQHKKIHTSALVPAAAAPAAAAPAAVTKIPVVLIGDMHHDQKCAFKTTETIISILDPYRSNPGSYLVVSELTGINPCYQALIRLGRIDPSRVLSEYSDSEINKSDFVGSFIHITNLLDGIADGTIVPGVPNPRIPAGFNLDKRFFMSFSNGFRDILVSMPDGQKIYLEMVDDALSHNNPGYKTNFLAIMTYLATSSYLDDNIYTKALKQIIDQYIQTNNEHVLRSILPEVNIMREKAVMDKVEARVRTEPNLRIVIIVFGGKHYNPMVGLIRQSSELTLDPRSVNLVSHLVGGNKIKRKTTKIFKYKTRKNKKIRKHKRRTFRNRFAKRSK